MEENKEENTTISWKAQSNGKKTEVSNQVGSIPLKNFDDVIKADQDDDVKKSGIAKFVFIIIGVLALIAVLYFIFFKFVINKENEEWNVAIEEFRQEVNLTSLNIATIQELINYYNAKNTPEDEDLYDTSNLQSYVDNVKISIKDGIEQYNKLLIPSEKTISGEIIIDKDFLKNAVTLNSSSTLYNEAETETNNTLADATNFTITYTFYNLSDDYKKQWRYYSFEILEENINSFKTVNTNLKESVDEFLAVVLDDKALAAENEIIASTNATNLNIEKAKNIINEITDKQKDFNDSVDESNQIELVDLTEYEDIVKNLEERSQALSSSLNSDNSSLFPLVEEGKLLVNESNALIDNLTILKEEVETEIKDIKEEIKAAEEALAKQQAEEAKKKADEAAAKQKELDELAKAEMDKYLEELAQWEKEQAEINNQAEDVEINGN